jgi:hypothetical protein
MGGRASSVTHRAISSGMPEKPRKRTKISTPQITVKIMTVSFAESSRHWRSSPRLMPFLSAKANTEKAPSAPASVGVAQPKYMLRKMIRMTRKIGVVPGSDWARCGQV